MKKTIEFRLKTLAWHCLFLLKLLDKGKNIYNLALSECKKTLNKISADKEYTSLLGGRRRLKKEGATLDKINAKLQSIVKTRYGLTRTGIEKFVKNNANYLMDGFNSQFAQVLADRAFETAEKVRYGKSRKVRFKGKWDNIRASVHSKSTNTGFFFDPKTLSVVYGKIRIPIVTEYRNDQGYHKYYLDQICENIGKYDGKDISYIRIVRRILKGKDVFYVQFVIDTRMFSMSDEQVTARNLGIQKRNAELIRKAVETGKPSTRLNLKHLVSDIREYPKTSKTIELIRSLGLSKQFQGAFDMGPKHMAVFLRNEQSSIALFQPIVDKLTDYAKEMRLLQRHLDRQRRQNNPDNFNADGTIRKGKKLKWHRSKAMIVTQGKIRELHRAIRETRKTVQRELASIIVALSDSLKTEDVSYKSWQKAYGKSVGNFAPSLFMTDVFSNAESAGSETTKIPLKTALSQLCVCGLKKKKKLSQRVHDCECGVRSQRDVFSSYLALFYQESVTAGKVGGRLMVPLNHKADGQLLEASCRLYSEVASGRILGFALGLDRRPSSRSCSNEDRHPSENGGRLMVCKDLKSLVGELGSGSDSFA